MYIKTPNIASGLHNYESIVKRDYIIYQLCIITTLSSSNSFWIYVSQIFSKNWSNIYME